MPEDEDIEYRLEVGDDYEPAGPPVVPVESVELEMTLVQMWSAWMLSVSPWRGRHSESYSVAIQHRMSVVYGHLVSAVQHAVFVELGGDKVVVSRPSPARDDVTNASLDPGMTFDGMLRELKALESLKVGDVVWERSNEKVITTTWVLC